MTDAQGINPIEASLVLGALYYFYGPNVLYEYAREAGKLFSTYAPIVGDVATDIFLEFRDYLEVRPEPPILCLASNFLRRTASARLCGRAAWT